jgi:type II secretory pathway pseudopilin PulG
MKNLIAGLTLIDLVLLLTIIGVLGVMTIPDYLDARAQALIEAKWEKSGEVKRLYRGMLTQGKPAPSVSTLAAQLRGERVAAQGGGIRLQIDGRDYVIPTYRNTRCTQLTQHNDEAVACVGTIPS